MRSPRLSLLSPLALVGLVTACIEPVTGAADTRQQDTQTTDTASHDTASHDTTNSDTTLTCVPANCDDGDPCSADWCDTSTGQCDHTYPPSAAPGAPVPIAICASAAECDDGDPCTADSCEVVGDSCVESVAPRFCVSRAVPGCGSGCESAAACDDGNVCTVDSCLSGGCDNQALEGCEPECSADRAITVSQAGMGRFSGDAIVAAGEAWMWQNDMACTDDGICNCFGSLALRDTTGAMLMRSETTPASDAGWRCNSRDSRNPGIICEPMYAGVSYIAWGAAGYSWDVASNFAAAAAPLPQADAMAVAGWCLEPTLAGLSGEYSGEIHDVWGQRSMTFDATIREGTEGEATLVIRSAQCDGAPCNAAAAQTFLPDQTVTLNIWAAGGRADFTYSIYGGSETVAWRYFGAQNKLTGRWTATYAAFGVHWTDPSGDQTPTPVPPADEPGGGSGEADVAVPLEGTMTLVRKAPGDLGSACE